MDNALEIAWLEPQSPEEIIEELITKYDKDRFYCLFSGGKDSVCTADFISRNYPKNFAGVLFTNTGLATQLTRKFVLEYTKKRGWPLFFTWASERERFYNVVMKYGFAGRGNHRLWMGYLKHHTWYYFLKERLALGEKAAFISGVRKKESWARSKLRIYTKKPIDVDSHMVFAKPFLYKNGTQLWEYYNKWDLEKSKAYDFFDKSGECWCGAYSHKWELKMLEKHDRLTYEAIRWLEKQIVKKRDGLIKKNNITETQIANWCRIYNIGVLKDGKRLSEIQKQVVRLTLYANWGSGPSTLETEEQSTMEDYCGESCEA